jgi:hypothetical protein
MKSRNSARHAKISRTKAQKNLVKRIVIALLIVLSVGLIFGSGKFFPGDNLKTKAQSVSSNKNISPEALQQIEALSREKESRTETQKKIDSRLLYQAKMTRGEAIADGVPALETGLKVDEQGFIDVDISANVNKKLLAVLEGMRAEIIASFPEYHSVTARVPLSEVENLASRADVIFIQPKSEMMTNQSPNYSMENSLMNNISEPTALNYLRTRPAATFQTRAARVREFLTNKLADDQLTGTATTQADTTHRAGLGRTIASVTGAGLKIGVLSNGVSTLAARQASGDLPAVVTVLAGQAGSGDEGTAMLELVYDVAPGAQLYFATANPTNAQFAQNIKDLRTAGCDIIVDDVSYFNESPFQNGQAPSVVSPGNASLISQAVNDVTIGSQAGALYFSSAANSGNKNDNTAGVWEGDFVDGGGTTAPLPLGNNVHNFGGGVTQNTLTVAGRITLKWSDPVGGSGNDYDLYVLNSAGTTIVASSTNVQSGTQDPYEDAGNRNAGEKLVIVKKAAAANRFLHLNTNRGVLTVSTTGVIYGHNGGVNTISVAATPAGPATFDGVRFGPFPNAHSGTNVVEQFSSDGPRRIFYNADGTQITPGNVSSTGGQLLQKPDITAADGTTTTTPTFIPFFGTSAAAPHAAALMALVKQASPGSTSTQLYNAMVSSAIDIEAPGVDRDSGAGIFMPLRAMNALGVNGPAFLETGAISTSEFRGNGNGRLEPGESANMTVSLNNLGLSNATGISATLTTSTPGVFILNTLAPEAISYPNLPAAVGTGTNAVPFRFGLDASAFACGSPISFTLTVNYAGGTAPAQVFNFTVQTDAQVTINSTLDTTAPPSGTNYTATTGTQTGRLNRNGVISTCGSPKATPALQDSTVGRRFDAYTFTASASGCTTVTLSTTLNNATNSMYLAVYGNSGYVPTAIMTNYLADWGVTTGGTVTVGFNATAGQQFTIVLHEITVGAGIGANYTLNVSGPITGACALAPTAASVTIAGRVASNDGRAVRNAIVTLVGANGSSYSGRTNSFGYYTIAGVPAGETYTASVTAKGLTFAPQIVNVADSVDGLNFTAEP